MTHCEGGVLPPAEDDPHNPGETLLAVLEDRVLPQRRLRQWQAAGPEEAVTSFLQAFLKPSVPTTSPTGGWDGTEEAGFHQPLNNLARTTT